MLSLAFALFAGAQTSSSDILLLDTRGRPVIRVRLDEQGPFDMVIDTAAQVSLVAPAVVEQLGLRPEAEQVTINGATRAKKSNEHAVARIQNGAMDIRDTTVLALPNARVTEARGIIGMDVFQGRKLTFDRRAGRFANEPSAAPARGYVAHKGDIAPIRLCPHSDRDRRRDGARRRSTRGRRSPWPTWRSCAPSAGRRTIRV